MTRPEQRATGGVCASDELPRSGESVLARAVAAILLVLTSPLWLFCAALVRLSVGRPLLFRQTRSGLSGRPFTILKFRTMRDTRAADGTLLPDASRMTAVTRFVRATRLDELPQLLSILRGDMAFVGPRPLLPATIAGFGDRGRLRCTVPPGLTGWSQINGNTQLTDRQKLALDLWYIRHHGFWLDLRILASTLLVVLAGERLVAANIARAAADLDASSDAAMGEARP